MTEPGRKFDPVSVLLWTLAVVALLAAGWNYFGPAPSGSATLRPPVTDGLQEIAQQQIREAYERAAAVPEAASNSGMLAMLLHLYGQYDAALEVYARTRELAPNEFQWPHLMGVVARRLGNDTEARQYFAAAVALNPGYTASRQALAELDLAAGRHVEAEQGFRTVLELSITAPRAHLGLGRALAAQGDVAGGLAELQQAIAEAPRYAEAHYVLAQLYRDAGNGPQAEKHLASYQRLQGHAPTSGDPLLESLQRLDVRGSAMAQRADRLREAGRLAESAALYERALHVDPELLAAHGRLIEVYGQLGEDDRAEMHFNAALQKNPDAVVIYLAYANFLLARGDPDAAARYAQRAAEINPNLAVPFILLGDIANRRGQGAVARAEFERALEVDPGNRQAAFFLGRQLILDGQVESGVAYLEQSLERSDEELSDYALRVARALHRIGQDQQALHMLDKARQAATDFGQWRRLAEVEQTHREWCETSGS